MKLICLLTFSLFFKVLFAQNIQNVVVWGADPTGKIDAVPAIQKAINAADPKQKNIIYFPPGKYLIASFTQTPNYLENYCLRMHHNLEFRGEGEKSIISLAKHIFKGNDSLNNAHLFYGREIQNVAFIKLHIDLNGAENTPAEGVKKNHAAIFVTHGRNVSLEKIKIINAAGTNMVNIKGRGSLLNIQDCLFKNEAIIQKVNCNQYDFSFVYSEWDSTFINKSKIVLQKDVAGICKKQRPYNGGIEIHGSDSWVKNCSISNCFPGMYIASTGKAMKNVIVSNNHFSSCTKGISFWLEYPMDSITIRKNTIGIVSERLEHFRFCTGIEVPNGNASNYNSTLANAASIKNLFVFDNIISASISAENASGIMLHSIQQSKIERNKIKGVNRYGIVLLGSKWGSSFSSISQNEIHILSENRRSTKQSTAYPIFVSDNFKQNGMRNCSFKKISVYNNAYVHKGEKSNTTNEEPPCSIMIEIPEKCKQNINECIEIGQQRNNGSKDHICRKYLP